MDREERTDGFTAAEDRLAGYAVYDRDGDRIGKVDDLFLDENDQPEYIGVKMGFFGLSSTLVPMDAVRADENERALYVQAEKERVKDGPRFDDDSEITPDYERQVREYYGLSATEGGERGSYGGYYGDEGTSGSTTTGAAAGATTGSTTGGEGSGTVASGTGQGSGLRSGDDLADRDELRVQRSEEELTAGVRERESGRVSVRKRVRTERERIAVPKRREEVTVERVSVNREASETELGEDEVVVPVVEEEVVVEKRPVVKEEIRVRKDVVQDEEIVEEDVRKEEVDIDDSTSGTTGRRGDRDI